MKEEEMMRLGKSYKGDRMFEPVQVNPILTYDSDAGSTYNYNDDEED
mgnify:CR=1 FL=1